MPDLSINLDDKSANQILGWYPWVSERQVLDRMLERKLRKAGEKELSVSEATIALRWFCQVPKGFKAAKDLSCAAALEKCVDLTDGGKDNP